MAYDIVWDTVTQIDPVSKLDVTNNDAMVSRGNTRNNESAENEGHRTIRHSALMVAVGLAVLWFFGGYIFKNTRI
jgi:hypothetical protein